MTTVSSDFCAISCAETLIDARKMFFLQVDEDTIRDSVWDILLELFAAREQGRDVCIKQVMLISNHSPAGIIRRLDILERGGFVIREPDIRDQRRVLVRLSDTGRAKITSLLRHIFEAPSRRSD